MIGKRVKNSFSFESADTKLPYEMESSGVGAKKVSIFNYSSTYFRKKVGQGPFGSYLLIGGNIPKDMESTKTFQSTPNGIKENPVPPLVCTLNKGTADRIRSFSIHNLSPNKIKESACGCIINPDWTANDCDNKLKDPAYVSKYNHACVKFVTNPTTKKVETVGIVKSIPKDCANDGISFEKGNDLKPNFIYLPTHQCSCSDHPRSEGFPHEDNYDCLKYYDAGTGAGVCCDTFGGGMKLGGVWSSFLRTRPDGSKYFDGKALTGGFYCADATNGDRGPLSRDNPLYWCSGKKSCDAGFVLNALSTPGLTKFKKQKCEDTTTTDPVTGVVTNCKPAENTFIRLFHVSGNEDCGCTGLGGAIYISGYTDYYWCQMECRKHAPGCGARGCFSTYDFIESIDVSYGKPISFCDMKYNDKLPTDVGDLYIWAGFIWPTTGFADFKNIEMNDAGGLRSVGCGNEIVYTCNDIP